MLVLTEFCKFLRIRLGCQRLKRGAVSLGFRGGEGIARYLGRVLHELLEVEEILALGWVGRLVADGRVVFLHRKRDGEIVATLGPHVGVGRRVTNRDVLPLQRKDTNDLPLTVSAGNEFVVEVLAVCNVLCFFCLVEGNIVDTNLFIHIVLDLVASGHVPGLDERGYLFLEFQFLFGSEGDFLFRLPVRIVRFGIEKEKCGKSHEDESHGKRDESVFEDLLVFLQWVDEHRVFVICFLLTVLCPKAYSENTPPASGWDEKRKNRPSWGRFFFWIATARRSAEPCNDTLVISSRFHGTRYPPG